MKQKRILNTFSLAILTIGLFLTSCSKDENVPVNPPVTSKTPKYNNGVFFVNRGISSINSNISFVSLKDNKVTKVYNSNQNHVTGIDGDDSHYYLSNSKLDNQGTSSILVKDVETFNDVSTITSNVENPIKVISHKDNIFVLNANNSNFFNPKPFISVYSKTDFAYKSRIELQNKARIQAVQVSGNKAYMILAPASLGEFKESLVILDLNALTTQQLTLSAHNSYDLQDVYVFNNEVYVSLSPGLSLLGLSKREIYKLNGNNFNLVYKIDDQHLSVESSKIASFGNDFYANSSNIIYKTQSGNNVMQSVFDNGDSVQFLRFISKNNFWVVSNGKLRLKDVSKANSNTELMDVSDPFSATTFILKN